MENIGVSQLLPRSVRTSRVSISGNERTKTSLFRAELNDELSNAKTLDDLYVKLSGVTERLLRLDIFDVVDTKIDVESITGDIYNAHVKIHVKEKGIPFLKASSYVRAGEHSSGNDVGCELQAAVRNPVGHGETLRVSSSTTQTGSKEFVSSLRVPNVSADRGDFTLTLRAGEESKSIYTSFQQQSSSVVAEYTSRNRAHQFIAEYSLRDEIPFTDLPSSTVGTTDRDFKPDTSITSVPVGVQRSNSGSFTYDTIFRPLTQPNRVSKFLSSFTPSQYKQDGINKAHERSAATGRIASLAVMHSAASSTKSSLRYQYTPIDSRDCAASPTSGEYLQGSVEVASSPGSVQFLKAEMSSQYHCTLTPSVFGQDAGVVASFCGSLGMIYPLMYLLPLHFGSGSENSRNGSRPLYKSYLTDRYQLGGPLSLRGFEVSGTGCRAYNRTAISVDADTEPLHSNVQTSQVAKTPLDKYALGLGDSLGGDTKSSMFLSLSVPVPIHAVASQKMRAFVFFNAGSLGRADYWKLGACAPAQARTMPPSEVSSLYVTSPSDHSTESSANGPQHMPLFGYLRAAVGGGISVAVADAVRLEGTYSVPIIKDGHDNLKKWQIGVGLSIN